jgi:hypothetical protein
MEGGGVTQQLPSRRGGRASASPDGVIDMLWPSDSVIEIDT